MDVDHLVWSPQSVIYNESEITETDTDCPSDKLSLSPTPTQCRVAPAEWVDRPTSALLHASVVQPDQLSFCVVKLAEHIKHSDAQKMVKVVCSSETPADAVDTLLQSVSQQQELYELELHVPLRRIAPSTISQLLTQSWSTLQKLNLSSCNLSDTTLRLLRVSMSTVGTTTGLPLQHLNFSHSRLNALACKEISHILRYCRKVRSLNVAHCHIDYYGVESLKCGLRNLHLLLELNLSHNSLCDCGMDSLMDVFPTLRNLQLLDLSSNFRGPFGSVHQMFNYLTRLRTLNLSGNWLRDFGVGYLLLCLRRIGRTLEHLILQDVKISNNFWEEVRMIRFFDLSLLTFAIQDKLERTHNHFSVKGLFDALKGHCFPSLRLLDLRGNNLLDLGNQLAGTQLPISGRHPSVVSC